MLNKDNFSCENCGECCKYYTVKLTEEEVKEIENLGFIRSEFCEPDDFDLDMGSFALLRPDGQCIFLTERNKKYYCKIYEKRPKICKDYPFNGVDFAEYCKPSLAYQKKRKP